MIDITLSWSNCLAYNIPESFEVCSGPPDLTFGRLPYFHSLMCSWGTSYSPLINWVAIIEPKNRDYLRTQIVEQIASKYEPIKGADDWNITSAFDNTFNNETQNVIGCIFAEGFRGPAEGYGSGTSLGNRGFITSPTTTPRDYTHKFSLGFKETNSSFTDSVIKPWAILASFKGLVARPDSESIKATITIYELARGDSDCSPSPVRKKTTFYDCVPHNISGNTLDHTTLSYNSSVDFIFNTYSINAV